MPPRTNEGETTQSVLRIALFTDLAPDASHAAAPSRGRREPVRVRKDGLAAFFAANATSVAIEVDDPFLDDGTVPLVVRLKDLKSLRPDLLAEDQPELRSLLGAHALLREAADGKITLDDAKTRIQRTVTRAKWSEAILQTLTGTVTVESPDAPRSAPGMAPAAAPAKAKAGSSILDQIDVDAPPAPRDEKTRMSSIIAAVARGKHQPGERRPDMGRATRLLERNFRLLMTRILAHPEVRRLASSWHAVRWLVERATSDEVELEVVSCPLANVAAAFEEMATREADGPLTPVDLVVVEPPIEHDAGLAHLAAWGKIAEGARIPVIAAIGPELLSTRDITALDRTARRGEIHEMLHPALRELAEKDEARWIVVVANAAFARSPYGVSRGAIPFEDASPPADLPSLSGSVLVASLVATSHTRTGWPTRIQGVPDGMVDDLPVVVHGDGNEDRVSVPLRGIVGESVSRGFGRAGVAVPACVPNRDTAVFFSVPMLHAERAGEARTTLADQLFLRRLAEAFELLAAAIPHGAATKAVEETATIVLAQLFAGQRPIPEVGVGLVDNGAKLVLMCRPNRFMGVTIERIDLAASLSR